MEEPRTSREVMVRRIGLFRKAGMVALVLSILGAGALYKVRTQSADVMEDPMLANYSKADTHQMEVLYGKMGSMITDLIDDLKRPGVQAVLIGLAGVVVAGGCFFVAGRLEDREAEE